MDYEYLTPHQGTNHESVDCESLTSPEGATQQSVACESLTPTQLLVPLYPWYAYGPTSGRALEARAIDKGQATKRGLGVPNPNSRGHATKPALQVPNPDSKPHAT